MGFLEFFIPAGNVPRDNVQISEALEESRKNEKNYGLSNLFSAGAA